MKYSIATTVFLLIALNMSSQTYQIVNNQIGMIFLNNWGFGGSGMSFYDFDHDGWDDLSIPGNAQSPRFYRNNGNGTMTYSEYFFNINQIKQITWVDFDNDGDEDIFMTRFQSSPVLLQNDGNFNFTDITVSAGFLMTTVRIYGHSWGDYDRDGDLDLYICNQDSFFGISRNYFYENNGNGTFTEKAVELGIDNGAKPSFQSAWFDYDNDGWPDLYVINELTTHANALYRNNGNGTFTDVSVASGSGLMIDAMSISVGDYDKDGWFDIYMSNLPAQGNRLLRNQGNGTFAEVPNAGGASVGSFCWGTNWLDFNNDTHLDIFSAASLHPGTTPSINYLYTNNGDNTFTYNNMSGFQSTQNESYGSAVGDYNNDGYPDIAINNRTPTHAQLWASSGGTAKWVKITLHGTISNRNAVGSRIELSAGGQTQYRYTMAGDNFLSQDSQHLIFGLGSATMVDSVKVIWPSGLTERFYNLAVQTNHNLTEGSTLQLIVNQPPFLCPGDSAVLSVPGLSSIQWSTGTSAEQLVVTESGEYSGVAYFANIPTPLSFGPVSLNFDPVPSLSVETTHLTCYGSNDGSVTVTVENNAGQSITWSNGAQTFSISDLPIGIYDATITTTGNCLIPIQTEIIGPDSISVTFQSTDVTCFGGNDGQLDLTSVVGGTGILTPVFEFNPDSLTAGAYDFVVQDENGCQSDYAFIVSQPDQISITLTALDTDEGLTNGSVMSEVSGGTPPYDYLWTTGSIETSISNLSGGTYGLWILDNNGCSLYAEATVSEIIGVGEMKNDAFFSVYPNPFGSYLVFSARKTGLLEVIDIEGKTIFREAVNGQLTISSDNWAAGLYVIKFTASGRTETKRMAKF